MAQEVNVVTAELCNACGVCVGVCPSHVIEVHEGLARTIAERAHRCILCAQCLAACPEGAMQVAGLPDCGIALPDGAQVEHGQLLDFLRARRSVRSFRDKPVERAVLEKVIEAASTAPMGFPPHTTEVVIFDTPKELDHLAEMLRSQYAGLLKTTGNPIGRAMVRLMAGAQDWNVLKTHIFPLAREANAAFAKTGEDRYMYEAPAMMLFHADPDGACYEENAHIVCTYAMLAAHAHGLGTTILGVVAPIVERSAELRLRYAIPKGNKVLTALILGYPKYKYKRGIRRELKNVHYADQQGPAAR